MTQYVIDIGAVANDGTGDPLRTAFNDTNLNFDQVFAAGPVLSNVQIANNKILTLNTNGNLILAPNGTGIVQSNVSILPNLANLRDLGSSTQRWRTVYTQYLDVSANLNITGNIIYNGDLNVSGNLTVQGNIIQVGNIVTETLTIQLANAASTANAANGSGITVGANDDIATLLYNSTGNTWTTNIGLSSVGNITAPYFFGNGSQLTGLAATYGNANVVANLAALGSNPISTTGNVTAGNVRTTGVISATGNVTANNVSTNDVNAANVKVASGVFSEFLAPTGKNGRGIDAIQAGVQGGTFLGSDVIIQITGNSNAYTQFNFQNINTGNLSSTDYVITADNGDDNTHFLNMGLAGSNHADPDFFGDSATSNDAYIYVVGADATGPGDTGPGNLIIGSTNGTIKMFVGNTTQANVVQTVTRSGITVAGNITGGNLNSATLNNSGNISVVASGNTWTFGSNGNLTLPYGAALRDTAGNSVAFGSNAGNISQSTDSVAIGTEAGANSQERHNVAIGTEAGMNNQGEDSVAIGWLAGRDDQTSFSIAIGWNAGSNTQGQLAQAYGRNAGAYYQKNSAIAMGYGAARYLQGQSAIAIGSNAGYGGPQGTTVASMPSPDVVRVFGSTSTLYNGMTAVGGSIEPTTGITIVGLSGEDITLSSVPATPLTNGTTLYFYPAQGSGGVAIGSGSAQALQGQNAVAVGYRAGQTRQGNSSVSIGEDAGYTTQGANAISIGSAAGSDTQGAKSISIGLNAGRTTQGQASIAMGFSAGFTGQGNSSVALGEEAGYTTQGQNSIAIGRSAGQSSQGNSAIAMGWTAAQTTQGNAAVAIGEDAGRYYQGEYSIAIGRTAGFNLQANNSIILNATGLHVNATTANSFIVQPIRNATTGNVLYYDEFTGEITFDVGGSGGLPVANGTSNFDIATANGNATITAASGNTWTFGTDGNLTLPGNIIAINYANGNRAFGNVTFSSEAVIGTGTSNTVSGLYLAPDPVSLANDLYLRVRGNILDEPTHIHFDTGNNQYYNQFIGDDNKYVQLANTGNIIINTSDYVGNTAQWTFGTTGNLTAPGNVSAVGNIIGGNIVTSGNITTAGSGGDITLTSGNITGVGNISAGNISATGNVTAANFFGNGNTLSNVATTFESTWTVPVGNSTQSFTVTPNNTYYMWVDCNITNGILAWNATATVTNTNVPVVGAQYAWVYSGGGTPIDFTSIPNQFTGTANTIVRSSTAPSSTTNRFDFDINNTSGNSQTVRYGWAQIS